MPDNLLLPDPYPLDSRRRRESAVPDEDRPRPVPHDHGAKLRGELSSALSARPRIVIEGVDPRQVFKIRATTRLSDSDLRPRGLVFLGDTENWTYFVVPNDIDGSTLRADVDAYEQGTGRAVLSKFFGAIDAIEPYGPDDRLGPGVPTEVATIEDLVVDVLIWPSRDQSEANQRLGEVQTVLAARGGSQVASDRRPLTTMVRARVSGAALESLLDLLVVERVRTPVAPFLEPSDWIDATLDELEIPDPLNIVVGVIDDGVLTGHPLLAQLVAMEGAVPDGRSWPDPTDHGTMVCGLAVYGDFEVALRDGTTLPTPTHFAVVRVLEPDGTPGGTRFATELPEHLTCEQAIRLLHAQGVRIMNLSITDRYGYSGPHVGLWTETLDRLARELDIVIVVCAGNRPLSSGGAVGDGHVLAHYPTYALDPEARIAEPAMAAIACTVGSIARSGAAASPSGTSDPRDHSVAKADQLSPFSRTGPGVHGTRKYGAIKPEFVEYGGNVVWSEFGRTVDRNLGTSSVSLTNVGGGRLFGAGSGTSFAAPRVAHAAAEILERYPSSSANLVRALLGASARIPESALAQFNDAVERHRAFGYGTPSAARATDSTSARVAMTFDGELDVDTAVIHPIPIPVEFATGSADRTISVALAFDPPVRRQRREYIAGRLTMDFYRAVSLNEVEALMRKQPVSGGLALPTNRRRIASKLQPGSSVCEASTLQVRRWNVPSANSLLPDDGDTYYLVVKHYREEWASALTEPYERQRYALVVELEDRTRSSIDLYALLTQQIQQVARIRV